MNPDDIPEYIIVTTTTDTRDLAQKIARAAVTEKLAACVEIHPIDSVYPWKGEMCETPEFLLMIKTRSDLYPQLEAAIRSLHTYDLPQIIALPITHGLPAYLDWIKTETKAL